MARSNATLFLNAYEKTISYKGVQKEINDSFGRSILFLSFILFGTIQKIGELFVYRRWYVFDRKEQVQEEF